VVGFNSLLSGLRLGYGLILTTGHLQATLSNLLTYYALRSTQLPTLRGTGNE